MIDLKTLLLAKSVCGGGSGLPTGGAPYQQLVTDGEGNAKWEDRLAYEKPVWKDFKLTTDELEIDGFSLPDVGETVTVKVNGVESVETVKYTEEDGLKYNYIGDDYYSVISGDGRWCIAAPGSCYGVASEEVTISLFIKEIKKIDGKFQDLNFIRPFSYYVSNHFLLKTLYNDSGKQVLLYICDEINLPKTGDVSIGNISCVGCIKFGSIGVCSFFATHYAITESGTVVSRYIFGTNETEMTELAANYGYTHTTNPTT